MFLPALRWRGPLSCFGERSPVSVLSDKFQNVTLQVTVNCLLDIFLIQALSYHLLVSVECDWGDRWFSWPPTDIRQPSKKGPVATWVCRMDSETKPPPPLVMYFSSRGLWILRCNNCKMAELFRSSVDH